MLWEGACLAWAKGAKAGLLRATAAKTNWAPWEREMTVARDSEGPCGYLRLSVKTKDNVINFQDIFKGEHLGAHTEARMNLTHDQLCRSSSRRCSRIPSTAMPSLLIGGP